MILSVTNQIGESQSWKDLPWKKFERHLFGLQSRLFKAAQIGDKKKIKSLQNLIARSDSTRYISIRQVTQLNSGKRTEGVDGKANLTEEERMSLAQELKNNWSSWKPSSLRSIKIPKKNGKMRVLKIPTIRDRAWQCVAKNVIEPAHEAHFDERSYGFRPGRSCHDAQKFIFQNLNSHANGNRKLILELDIEKCFDKINHNSIMEKIIAPGKLKLGIFRSLKKGVTLEFPEQGTPQGGVISPLLSNIVLNGIEKIHKSVRYADDMIFILKEGENPKAVLNRVKEFLEKIGLKINEEKTKITSSKIGFNFLGWHFVSQRNGICRITPSKENFEKFREKLKNIISNSSLDVENKVIQLSRIVRGWRNYHKYCHLKAPHTLWHLEAATVKAFKTKGNTLAEAIQSKEEAFPKVAQQEGRFIQVKGKKSPYDGDMIYWSKRNSKNYSGFTAMALKKQHHSCHECKHIFWGNESVQLHHVDWNHANWKKENLVAVHKHCHDKLHRHRIAKQ
jgi:group II intron reverse transcriptase/maturase